MLSANRISLFNFWNGRKVSLTPLTGHTLTLENSGVYATTLFYRLLNTKNNPAERQVLLDQMMLAEIEYQALSIYLSE